MIPVLELAGHVVPLANWIYPPLADVDGGSREFAVFGVRYWVALKNTRTREEWSLRTPQ
jgi:hypothetical protein